MKKLVTTVLFVVLMGGMLSAQQSKEELSAAAANPLADLMSFPFQNNLNMNNGEYKRNFYSPLVFSTKQKKINP